MLRRVCFRDQVEQGAEIQVDGEPLPLDGYEHIGSKVSPVVDVTLLPYDGPRLGMARSLAPTPLGTWDEGGSYRRGFAASSSRTIRRRVSSNGSTSSFMNARSASLIMVW